MQPFDFCRVSVLWLADGKEIILNYGLTTIGYEHNVSRTIY
jgi:hypothetical protein